MVPTQPRGGACELRPVRSIYVGSLVLSGGVIRTAVLRTRPELNGGGVFPRRRCPLGVVQIRDGLARRRSFVRDGDSAASVEVRPVVRQGDFRDTGPAHWQGQGDRVSSLTETVSAATYVLLPSSRTSE